MSQYSPGYPNYQTEPFMEQRTSVMAVLSLVFALICCPPGPAVLGTIFGVAALIVIANSNGRLVGRGLAIAGIIISLIVSSVWLGLSIGGGHFWAKYQKDIAAPMSDKFRALDSGDFATFRTMLTAEANAKVTDADIEAFRAGYQAELGHVVGAPGTLIDYARQGLDAADAWKLAQGRNDVFPMVMTFDKGPAVMFLVLDPKGRSNTKNNNLAQFENIELSTPKGSKWKLWDKPSTSGTTPPKPTGTSPDAPKPQTPTDAEKPAEAPADKPTDTPPTPTPAKPD